MDKKKRDTLFFIASVGLDVAGIIFLCVFIFAGTKNKWLLIAGIGCVVLSNLFNVIKSSLNKKEKE